MRAGHHRPGPKRALHVEEATGLSTEESEVEMVERKGKGHPDSLIDGAAEAVSDALAHYYLRHFGRVLHYNVDKGILVGGSAVARFGGGEVIEPVYIMVAGRATRTLGRGSREELVPIAQIAREAIKGYIAKNMRFLDPEKHVEIETRIRQGSSDLVSIFMGEDGMPLSNDTSIGVGYAPLTITEKVVLGVEKHLNSASFKRGHPEVGEDVKVLGLRKKRALNVIVAAAMISGKLDDAGHYAGAIEEVKEEIERIASPHGLDARIQVNTGDDYKKGRFYLTVTGTSAEQGDDGNTGRGNRVNGVISPMRHYSMEATAGKNPVNHTGKIYNVLAALAAEKVVKEVPSVKECYVRILSKIGSPIDRPEIASAAVNLQRGAKLSSVRGDVESIVDESMSKVREVTQLILKERIALF